jgi:carbon monoxide dehydrogenase subunit G
MKVNGSYTIAAPQGEIWPLLLDPQIIANIMPGCESLEQVSENEYTGTLKIKVGPVQGKFNGNIILSNIMEPDGYHIAVDGRGTPGFVKGEGDLRLEPDGENTILHYDGDAQVGGRLASVGQRLLDSSAKAIIRQSLEGLENQVDFHLNAKPSNGETGKIEGAPPPAEAPSQTEFAMGVARHMIEDMFAEENQGDLIRKAIIAGSILLVIYILFEWFTTRLADKVARRIESY